MSVMRMKMTRQLQPLLELLQIYPDVAVDLVEAAQVWSDFYSDTPAHSPNMTEKYDV